MINVQKQMQIRRSGDIFLLFPPSRRFESEEFPTRPAALEFARENYGEIEAPECLQRKSHRHKRARGQRPLKRLTLGDTIRPARNAGGDS